MTTNSAMGGNMAIESAACLANCLVRAFDASRQDLSKGGAKADKSFVRISENLAEYQKIRFVRAQNAMSLAGKLTRSQFLPNLWTKFTVRYLLPRTTPAGLLGNFLRALDGGVRLDFLAAPKRARRPPASSIVQEQPKASFAAATSRLLGLFLLVLFTLNYTIIRF